MYICILDLFLFAGSRVYIYIDVITVSHKWLHIVTLGNSCVDQLEKLEHVQIVVLGNFSGNLLLISVSVLLLA